MLDLSESTIYEFGEFRLDTQSRRLFRRGEKISVSLTPKAVEVLMALVQNRSRLVTKDELLDTVWAGAFVEESNLTQTIFVLRKAIGDDPKQPEFILTIPNRGYQFIGDVTEVGPGDEILDAGFISENRPPAAQPPTRGHSRPVFITLASLVGVALLIAAVYRFYPTQPTPSREIRTIAILPFEDLSDGQQDKYLGVGIADALAKQFGTVRSITVRPFQSVLKYIDRRDDRKAIGQALQVDAVVEGRIQRIGDRLRVSVQLIRVADDSTVWTESFDDAFTNLFAVQDAVSGKVATSLALRMDDTERRRFTQRGTADVEAYQAYMRGRYFWNKRSPENLYKAIEQFDAATKRDPDYALAYTGLADCYQLLPEYWVAEPKDAFPKARVAAERALSIDSNLAEAHTSLAYTQAFYEWDFGGAERSFKWALDIDPGYSTAHQWYAELLQAHGRFDEARMHLDRALEADPASPILMAGVAGWYHITRDFDGAIEQSKKIIAMDPNFAFGYYYLGASSSHKGLDREAVDAYAHLLTLFGEPAVVVEQLEQAFVTGGMPAYQKKRVEQMETIPHLKLLPHFNRAFVYTGSGDQESALRELKLSVERHERLVIYLKYAPDFDPLRDDPRYDDLIKQIGV